MCMVSAVSGGFQQAWPAPFNQRQISQSEYEFYQDCVRKAKLFDEINKQPDCPDPKKEEWMRQLAEFMEKRYVLQPKP